MPARTIELDAIPYRIFVNREQGRYRGFWFCPHHDCYGAYRCDFDSDTSEDAIEIATEAARIHESELHAAEPLDELYPQFHGEIAPASLKIHG
jgi:hypothetical protein